MSRTLNKKILMVASLAAIVFLTWVIIIAPVSAAPAEFADVKIDPTIYTGINDQGNPTGAVPHDLTWFHFTVYYEVVNEQLDGSGNPTGAVHVERHYVGQYDANTRFQAHFPLTYGKPEDYGTVSGCFFWYCWHTHEFTRYSVEYANIPTGYCPMYPEGIDYKKGDTATVVHKFFKGAFCGYFEPMPTPATRPLHRGIILIQ